MGEIVYFIEPYWRKTTVETGDCPIGMNPSRNLFKQARLGIVDQRAVDAYKAASVWAIWWDLSEATRRRYFTTEERKFIRRYGAKLDEIASMRTEPANDDERHFLQVCMGHEEPRHANERLWLYVRMVCRYEGALERATRADLTEFENNAPRIEIRTLKADRIAREREYMEFLSELRMERGKDIERSIGNVVSMTQRFLMQTSSPQWTSAARPSSGVNSDGKTMNRPNR